MSLPSYPSLNSLKESMPFSDICTCVKFITTTVNNKASYIIAVVSKEKDLIGNFA